MNFDANAILALAVPVVSPLITAGMKWLIPRLPPWLIPMLCTGLGTLSAYVGKWVLGAQVNSVWAIGLGLAGIGVREIIDQLKPKQDEYAGK